MKDLFMFAIVNMAEKFGKLTKATFYGRDYATIEFESNDKIYSVNISCEEKKEEQQ